MSISDFHPLSPAHEAARILREHGHEVDAERVKRVAEAGHVRVRECMDNDSPWLVCKTCAAAGHCAKAWEAPSGTEAAVCEDIAKRQRRGIAKYGVTVQGNPLTLREWLHHAYEECLDQAVYLKRAIAQLDADQAGKKVG